MSIFSSEEPPANRSRSQDSGKVLKTQEVTSHSPIAEYLIALNPNGASGKTFQASSVQVEDGILVPSSGRWANSGMGSRTESWTLSTSEWHSGGVASLLSDTLETGDLPRRFYLSPTACAGILRRAERRGKVLPPTLQAALLDTAKELAPSEQMEETLEEDQKT